MFVDSLDHVNIRVKDVDATLAFFNDVLDMPCSPERRTWIVDAQGRPVIHVGSIENPYPSDSWRPFESAEGTGVVHHVALGCTGYDVLLARLQERGLPHNANHVPHMKLRQIFVEEPNGVLLELNFRGE